MTHTLHESYWTAGGPAPGSSWTWWWVGKQWTPRWDVRSRSTPLSSSTGSCDVTRLDKTVISNIFFQIYILKTSSCVQWTLLDNKMMVIECQMLYWLLVWEKYHEFQSPWLRNKTFRLLNRKTFTASKTNIWNSVGCHNVVIILLISGRYQILVENCCNAIYGATQQIELYF